MGQTMSRGEIQDLVSKFAVENPKYRDALIKDPKNVIEKLPDPPSAVEPVLLEYLEVALAVYLDLGEVSTASKLLESCGGCLSRPGRVVIKLLSAEIAARSGEWQKVGRLLGSIEDPDRPDALRKGRDEVLGCERAIEADPHEPDAPTLTDDSPCG